MAIQVSYRSISCPMDNPLECERLILFYHSTGYVPIYKRNSVVILEKTEGVEPPFVWPRPLTLMVNPYGLEALLESPVVLYSLLSIWKRRLEHGDVIEIADMATLLTWLRGRVVSVRRTPVFRVRPKELMHSLMQYAYNLANQHIGMTYQQLVHFLQTHYRSSVSSDDLITVVKIQIDDVVVPLTTLHFNAMA